MEESTEKICLPQELSQPKFYSKYYFLPKILRCFVVPIRLFFIHRVK